MYENCASEEVRELGVEPRERLSRSRSQTIEFAEEGKPNEA